MRGLKRQSLYQRTLRIDLHVRENPTMACSLMAGKVPPPVRASEPLTPALRVLGVQRSDKGPYVKSEHSH
jgi:hypothetical protein